MTTSDAMVIKAALNGGRVVSEHPGVSVTSQAAIDEARRFVGAGASAVRPHARTAEAGRSAETGSSQETTAVSVCPGDGHGNGLPGNSILRRAIHYDGAPSNRLRGNGRLAEGCLSSSGADLVDRAMTCAREHGRRLAEPEGEGEVIGLDVSSQTQ
jgi:uncharacterized protein (DUF849 family)